MYLCALNSRAYVGFLILSGQRIAYSLGKRHGRLANSMFVMTSSFLNEGPSFQCRDITLDGQIWRI